MLPLRGRGMVRDDPWTVYVVAMRDHLAQNERLSDRLRYFIGDARSAPVDLSPQDLSTWLGLVRDAEDAARRHRRALESLDSARRRSP